MKKQKMIYTICLPVLAVFLLTEIMLFVFGKLSLFAFIGMTIGFIGLIALDIFLLVKVIKKINKLKKEKENAKFVSSGNYMIDLYGILGIPVQYNPDGTIKDIYELLGITPIYDENGDRVLTIYELLGIMPLFTKEGKEIPTILVIKNRVKRFAKVDLSTRVLHRRLSEKEREEQLIRQTLRKQMEIAEQNKDKAKVNKIKKVLKDKESGSSKPKFIVGKPLKKADGLPKISAPDKKLLNVWDMINNAMKSSDKDKKGASSGQVVKTPRPQPERVNASTNPQNNVPGKVYSGEVALGRSTFRGRENRDQDSEEYRM